MKSSGGTSAGIAGGGPSAAPPPAAPELGSAPAPAAADTAAAAHGAGSASPGTAAAALESGRAPFRLGYRPQLDGVRGIAVILVVVYHVGRLLWPEASGWLAPGGFLGVDLFFVLSGFLITSLLLAEAEHGGGVALGAFAVRRVRRLVPALVALMTVLLAIALAGRMYDPAVMARSVVTVLTFSHNWAIGAGWRVELGYLWTVAVEAQFYVLWAVVVAAAVRARRPHLVLAVAAAVGIVAVVMWRLAQVEQGEPLFFAYVGTASRLDAPLVGALAGVVAAAGWLPAFRGRAATVGGTVGLAVLVGAAMRLDSLDEALYRGLFTLLALGAAVGVLAAVRAGPGRLTRSLALRPLVAAGIISYSLYVWHLPIFEMVGRNTPGWHPLPRVALGVTLAVVAAVASYRFVERPFRRRRAARA